jgi:hypothetical protein
MPRARATSTRTTKGWAKAAPKTRTERRALFARCGAAAFLQPNRSNPGLSKYPIVGKHGSCAVDCRGLQTALRRAGQFHHPAIQRKAQAKGRRVACAWA